MRGDVGRGGCTSRVEWEMLLPGGKEGTAKTLRIVIWLHIAGSAMHMGIKEGRNELEGWRSEPRARPWRPQVLGQVVGLSSGSAEPGTCCAECCVRHYEKSPSALRSSTC